MFNTKSAEKKPVIIAVAAGKGGVGKSTVAVNLSLALKQQNYRVGLLDTDIYGPSVRRMLPEDISPMQKGERITPAISSGIRMISMAYFRKEHEPAAIRAPIANSIINQFLNQVDWGVLDFLIIDFPPGTGDIQLTLSQKAHLSGAILVTTPQEIALMDVRKACHLFHQVKVPIIGIVENMSYIEVDGKKIYPFGQGGGERLAQEINAPLLETIPLDPELCKRADLGKSPFDPMTQAGEAFLRLAGQVAKYSSFELPVKRVENGGASLVIEWEDGRHTQTPFSQLQSLCPCAACLGEAKGPFADSALDVSIVGRFGIKVKFATGCSNGIYGFDRLQELVK